MSDNAIKMLSINDKTMTTELDRKGYRNMGVIVKTATAFDEAVKVLAAEAIDVIVINLDFAKINAIEICRYLKKTDVYKNIQIVVTSVQTSAAVKNNALDAGADLYVEQPLPRDYFIEKLKGLLEQKTRTTERIELPSDVTFSLAGKKHSYPAADISISGVLVSVDFAIEHGTKLDLEFSLPAQKKPIRVQGTVVRTLKKDDKDPSKPFGVGITFDVFATECEKRLENYINKSSHKNSTLLYYL